MIALSIIVSAPGLDDVRDVLRDWSAVGLIQPFAWTTGGSATYIENGSARRAATRDILTSTRAGTIVIAVLAAAVEGVEDVDGEVIAALEHSVGQSLGQGMSLVRMRITATLKGSAATLPTIATPGWSNVVLAAEEAAIPERGRRILDAATPRGEFATHVAAGLASALGLWTGLQTTVFGEAAAPQSAAASLTRSFVRRLDSALVESHLRALVLSTAAGLPLPRSSAGVEYIEDAPLATATMEEAYWRQHGGALNSGREQRPRSKEQKIGPFEAISMFFGFLWAAIRNAPRAWLASTIRKLKAETASTVNRLVFGSSDSAYVVVVGGVLPDGRPASWLDVGDAVDQLSVATGSAHSAHEDLTDLWTGYAAAALTLCDAGERVPGLAPIEIGARKGVLRRCSDAVPGPDARFTGLPPQLAAIIGTETIAPYDTLAAAEVESRLSTLAAQPGVGVAASTALEELRRWRSRFASSLAVRISSRIAGALTAVRSEIAQILERLRAATADDIDERLMRLQRKLATILRVVLIVVVVLLGVVVALFLFSIIGVELMLGLVGGLLITWLISSFVIFIRGQSALFRLMKEKRELISQQEVDEKNLRHALRDARRLVDAYSQFRRWSDVLGSVLTDPFGTQQKSEDVATTRLSGLPLSVVIGETEPDPVAMDLVSAELRRLAFEPGWLNAAWGSVLRNAHRRLGGAGIEFREHPELLFRQLGDGEHTVLPMLCADLERNGTDPEIGDDKWAESLRFLAQHTEMSDRLLQNVKTAEGVVRFADFMGAIDGGQTSLDQRLDDSALRTEVRIQAGKTAIEMSEPVTVASGLSRLVVLRQRSAGIPEYEFVAHAERRPGPAPWFNPDAMVL